MRTLALATMMCGISAQAWGQAKTPPTPMPQATFAPGGFNQTPWFTNPEIRQQLKLNDTQFGTLNQAYANAWADYERQVIALSPNLSDKQRQESMAALHQGLVRTFSAHPQKVLTDADQFRRFNQLHLQYRGFDAFSDPVVIDKLNLTPAQRSKLGELHLDWTTQVNKLTPIFNVNRDDAIRRLNTLQDQNAGQLDSILTPDQRKVWLQMIGNPYTFNPGVYFPPPSTPPNGK